MTTDTQNKKKSLGMKQVNNTEIFKLARKNNVIKAVTRLERAQIKSRKLGKSSCDKSCKLDNQLHERNLETLMKFFSKLT